MLIAEPKFIKALTAVACLFLSMYSGGGGGGGLFVCLFVCFITR